MIVGSILLVVVAAGLLMAGLLDGSDAFYYGSIVASVVAGFALVVGVRQISAEPMIEDEIDALRVLPGLGESRGGPRPGGFRVGGVGPGRVPAQAIIGVDDQHLGVDDESDLAEEPPDEPPPQVVASSAAARVAGLATQVVVIDGRPRYHLGECLNLLGREPERLPVAEAVELGFTPCGLCEPVTALLAGSARI